MFTRKTVVPLLFTALALFVIGTVVVTGCVPLDYAFTPNPATGVSPAQSTGQQIAPVIDGATGGPWGEIALAGLMLFQNIYLFVRRVQGRTAVLAAVTERAVTAESALDATKPPDATAQG